MVSMSSGEKSSCIEALFIVAERESGEYQEQSDGT